MHPVRVFALVPGEVDPWVGASGFRYRAATGRPRHLGEPVVRTLTGGLHRSRRTPRLGGHRRRRRRGRDRQVHLEARPPTSCDGQGPDLTLSGALTLGLSAGRGGYGRSMSIQAVVWDVDDTLFDYTTADRLGMRAHLTAEGLLDDYDTVEAGHRPLAGDHRRCNGRASRPGRPPSRTSGATAYGCSWARS